MPLGGIFRNTACLFLDHVVHRFHI